MWWILIYGILEAACVLNENQHFVVLVLRIRKLHPVSIRIVGVPAKIQTGHVPNTVIERYHYTNDLSK
jgi:hypothetical protein